MRFVFYSFRSFALGRYSTKSRRSFDLVVIVEIFVFSSDDEEVKIWLNPIPLSSEKFDSKRRVKINGIPHGKSVQIEIRSPMFSRRERHVIETNDFTEKSIAAIRIGPDGNFFASVKLFISTKRKIFFRRFD